MKVDPIQFQFISVVTIWTSIAWLHPDTCTYYLPTARTSLLCWAWYGHVILPDSHPWEWEAKWGDAWLVTCGWWAVAGVLASRTFSPLVGAPKSTTPRQHTAPPSFFAWLCAIGSLFLCTLLHILSFSFVYTVLSNTPHFRVHDARAGSRAKAAQRRLHDAHTGSRAQSTPDTVVVQHQDQVQDQQHQPHSRTHTRREPPRTPATTTTTRLDMATAPNPLARHVDRHAGRAVVVGRVV